LKYFPRQSHDNNSVDGFNILNIVLFVGRETKRNTGLFGAGEGIRTLDFNLGKVAYSLLKSFSSVSFRSAFLSHDNTTTKSLKEGTIYEEYLQN